MSRENATDFCNDCGGWKRITGRDGASPAVGNDKPRADDTSEVTLHLRYERSDWRDHREAYCAWISVNETEPAWRETI